VPERRALLIGVSGFTELADESLLDLDFAARAVEGLSQVLHDNFGYSVTTMTEPGLTTTQLGEAVRQALVSAGEGDIQLIHLLTHGVARENLLYALGCDQMIDETTEVGAWLAGVQYATPRPVTLFTLDLCNSGIVTQLPWQTSHDGRGRRGWVVAACEPDRSAFDGLFTRALTTVLRELANKDIRVSPDDEFISLKIVARAVRHAVVGMAKNAGSYQQYPVSSKLDMTADTPFPPFFLNPSHDEAIRERLRSPGDQPLRSLLGDVDFRHFIENATGSTAVFDLTQELIGCFSGRKNELGALSAWLNHDDNDPLAVVTGSPGAGKSALLGLLVCAAHPALRLPTTQIWEAGASTPAQVGVLCAVHAGERPLIAIATALGRQLGLIGEIRPDLLATALSALSGHRPVFVIDSLDEANDAREVVSWLIRLASLTRPDGSAAVKLLVGTRAYDETASLRALAEEGSGHLYDLDTVPVSALENDLYRYVTNLLRATPEYRGEHQTVGAFAGKLAETLVRDRRRTWGEFLVAGMFTRHFIDVFHPADGPGAAERLAGTVPQALPEVLDLDLSRHPDELWMRPVLRAVAYARGDGMPASVIRRVAAALTPGPSQPSPADITTALRASRPYLRQSVDSEKVDVYRLCHEGLAERLRRPEETEIVYHGILAGTGPADRRIWGAAEPYVLAHALDHAVDARELLDDPGFLLYADRSHYLPLLSEGTRRLVQGVSPIDSALNRRAMMARAAVEAGQPRLARRIADLPGEQPLPWLPLWADCALDETLPSATVVPAVLDAWGNLRVWVHGLGSAAPTELSEISSFALARQDGHPVIVTGNTHGAVQAIGPGNVLTVLATHSAVVSALAIAEYQGELIVVSGSEDGTVLAHSLSNGREICAPVNIQGSISALDAGGHALDLVGACTTAAGKLWTWRIGPGQNPAPYQWNLSSPALSVTVTTLGDGTVVLAGCEDGNARSLACQTHTALKVLGEHDGAVQAVAAEIVAGRTVAVTGDQSGHIRKWDLLSGHRDGERLQVCRGPVAALALRSTSNGLLCLAAGKGRIGGTALWELGGRRKQYEFGRSGAISAALSVDRSAAVRHHGQRRPRLVEFLTSADGLTAVIIGDHDGAVRAVEFDSGRPVTAAVEPDGYPVTSIGIVSLGGIPTAVIGSDRGVRLWQPFADAHVVVRARDRAQDALSSSWRNAIIVNGHLLTVTRSPMGALAIGANPIAEVGDVTVTTVTHLDGRPVALAGNQAGLVRISDLLDPRVFEELNVGGPVFAIAATTDGRLAVGAGGCVYAFERFSGHQAEA